jgi:hypothetical protein
MKNKETLEEVMNKDGYHESNHDKIWREGVQLGVKWQAERMYSEEEVLDLLHRRSFHLTHKKDTKTTKEWFEPFKKK